MSHSRELERDIYNRTIQEKIELNRKLKIEIHNLEHKVHSLKKSVEYRQNKAKKNQEVADWYSNLERTPGILKEDGTIDWYKVYLLYK